MEIRSPESMQPHIQKILNGEYALPPLYLEECNILDLGANVGAFAVWAANVFPKATIYCYEPMKSNFEFLVSNTKPFGSRIKLNNFAVGNPDHTQLFVGKHNCGEASFFQLGEQTLWSETVVVKPPSCLPQASIIKIDTEGCELEILKPLIDLGRLWTAVMCEYHREADRREIDRLLADYVLVGGEATRAHRGVVKYLHKSLIKE